MEISHHSNNLIKRFLEQHGINSHLHHNIHLWLEQNSKTVIIFSVFFLVFLAVAIGCICSVWATTRGRKKRQELEKRAKEQQEADEEKVLNFGSEHSINYRAHQLPAKEKGSLTSIVSGKQRNEEEEYGLLTPEAQLEYDLRRADQYLGIVDNLDLQIKDPEQLQIEIDDQVERKEHELMNDMDVKIGLTEIGQTGLANSILQCLVNHEDFVRSVITAKREGAKISNEIYNFVYKYRIEKDARAADALMLNMFSKSKILSDNKDLQSDIFLSEILNQITKDTGAKKRGENLIKGGSRTKFTCAQCEKSTESFEVLPPITVHAENYEKEKMTNLFREPREVRYCTKCHEKTLHVHSCTLENPPDLLIMRLETLQDGFEIFASQIMQDVTFRVSEGMYTRYELHSGVFKKTTKTKTEYSSLIKDSVDPKIFWYMADGQSPIKKKMYEVDCYPKMLFYKKKSNK